MAEAHYAQIAPHLYCGPVVGAANIQLAACTPNFLILEGIRRLGRLPRRDPDGRRSAGRTGYVIPPTEPGLGVELDEEVAARHPVRRRRPAPRCPLDATRRAADCVSRLRRPRAPRRAPRGEPPARRASTLAVHDRDAEAVRRLARGWCARPRARRRGRRAQPTRVITCLPSPAAVERRRRRPATVCSTALRHGGTWIDMSTNDRTSSCGSRRSRASAASRRSRRRSPAACTSPRRARSR